MTPNKIYPGMVDHTTVEFFVVENEEKIIQGGIVQDFSMASYGVIQILREFIKADPIIEVELKVMHPNSELKRIRQLVRCRFGGLDMSPDIKDGVLQDGDYWPCPLRGSCRSEGILCRQPQYKGKEITAEQVKLMKLISSNMTNETIAEVINKPMGSFHVMKRDLYKTLGGIQTKQEVALIAVFLNLI